jgi:hypothetical protein
LDLDIILGLEPSLQVGELLASGDWLGRSQDPETEATKRQGMAKRTDHGGRPNLRLRPAGATFIMEEPPNKKAAWMGGRFQNLTLRLI